MGVARAAVVAVALVGAGVARADEVRAEEVMVQRHPAATVLRDTLSGGLVGSAVSGVVILSNMGFQDRHGYDWGRSLAWGAGLGLAAGLVWGLVNAASAPSYAAAPVHDGMSASLDVHSLDQSKRVLVPLSSGRF